MTLVDLTPATRRMAALLDGIADDSLDRPTPCPDYRLGDLLDHVGGLARAFTAAARKDTDDPAFQSWTGTTQAGGIELPGEQAGVVALDELVLHGWDDARASDQAYDCDPALLEVVHDFVLQFSGPGMEEQRAGLFGPEVEIPDDAPLLDRVLGLAGRDPGWSGH